jgi:hypothetical protein
MATSGPEMELQEILDGVAAMGAHDVPLWQLTNLHRLKVCATTITLDIVLLENATA